jgi:hypothetical protein
MKNDVVITKLPNDIGGNPSQKISQEDHPILPWEKRCHALMDILDFAKIINTEEKRRGVEDLGKELIGKLTYYERWIVSANNILLQKQILTVHEINEKFMEVKARYPS